MDIIKPLIEKLASFLSIFDISFFISGFLCFTGLAALTEPFFNNPYIAFSFYFQQDGGVFFVIMASYILGLICFAAGRTIHRFIAKFPKLKFFFFGSRSLELSERFQIIKLGGYSSVPEGNAEEDKIKKAEMFSCYDDFENRARAAIRDKDKYKSTFSFIHSFWVRVAIYDSLPIGLLPLFLFPLTRDNLGFLNWIFPTLSYYLISQWCFFTAYKNQKFHFESIVATLKNSSDPILYEFQSKK